MDRSPVRDFVVGLFVLAGLGALAYLAISIGGFTFHGKGGLKLHAYFAETGGLNVRAPVVVAGVQVGEVTAITLEERDGTYRARVDLDLQSNLKLPNDTTASIFTSGMLGDRYISLQGGAGKTLLATNDEIRRTESGMVLERVLGAIGGGSNLHGPGGLKLHAYFSESGGLNAHAPVVLSGVQVGEVTSITLDERDGTYRARVDLEINRDVKLSADTTASIFTSGIIGGRYISLQNGADDKLLAANDEIRITESGMILERILGAIVYGVTKDRDKPATPATAPGSK